MRNTLKIALRFVFFSLVAVLAYVIVNHDSVRPLRHSFTRFIDDILIPFLLENALVVGVPVALIILVTFAFVLSRR